VAALHQVALPAVMADDSSNSDVDSDEEEAAAARRGAGLAQPPFATDELPRRDSWESRESVRESALNRDSVGDPESGPAKLNSATVRSSPSTSTKGKKTPSNLG